MHRMATILPCTNIDESQAFYERLGFSCESDWGDYRLMTDGKGGDLHLRDCTEGWLKRNESPLGLYFYVDDVDAMAARFPGEILEGAPQRKPWGTYEFAVSDPDGTLVRIGGILD
ncbi:VOC family protein [Sphingomonas koreensis]